MGLFSSKSSSTTQVTNQQFDQSTNAGDNSVAVSGTMIGSGSTVLSDGAHLTYNDLSADVAKEAIEANETMGLSALNTATALGLATYQSADDMLGHVEAMRKADLFNTQQQVDQATNLARTVAEQMGNITAATAAPGATMMGQFSSTAKTLGLVAGGAFVAWLIVKKGKF